MSVSITIRHVPEEVRDRLAARAARGGQSLQGYLLANLEQAAAQPSLEEVVDRARRRVRLAPTELGTDSILAARDADRR